VDGVWRKPPLGSKRVAGWLQRPRENSSETSQHLVNRIHHGILVVDAVAKLGEPQAAFLRMARIVYPRDELQADIRIATSMKVFASKGLTLAIDGLME
jgi:hypothetical protein